jgi:Putative Actinobacterial Holin-X, holin superfamily III
MLENHQADAQPGVASLVGGILEDTQKLFRQEIALAQREVAQAWDKGKTATALLASALVVFTVGGVLLGIMLAKLLYQLLPNHEWACYGIVGGLVALLGGALIYHGLHRINEVHMSLPQTTEMLREDVRAVREGVSGGRSSTEPLSKR